MMARCLDEQRYAGVIQVLFRTQNNWARAADPLAEIKKIGQLAGLGDDAFQSCLQSEALANGILAKRQEASAAGVRSTPTFEIEGRIYPGSRSLEEFSEILDPLLAKN
jgi:protein-disulfide isomerase